MGMNQKRHEKKKKKKKEKKEKKKEKKNKKKRKEMNIDNDDDEINDHTKNKNDCIEEEEKKKEEAAVKEKKRTKKKRKIKQAKNNKEPKEDSDNNNNNHNKYHLPFSIRNVCAPMVGASELAFRLLCRRYGTDLCYTPMMDANQFVENESYRCTILQTIDGNDTVGDVPNNFTGGTSTLTLTIQPFLLKQQVWFLIFVMQLI